MRILDVWVDEPMPLLPLDHPHIFEPYDATTYRCAGCGRLAEGAVIASAETA